MSHLARRGSVMTKSITVLKCNEINRGAKGNEKLCWLRPHWCLTGDSLSYSLLEEKYSQDYAWHTSQVQFSSSWLSSFLLVFIQSHPLELCSRSFYCFGMPWLFLTCFVSIETWHSPEMLLAPWGCHMLPIATLRRTCYHHSMSALLWSFCTPPIITLFPVVTNNLGCFLTLLNESAI